MFRRRKSCGRKKQTLVLLACIILLYFFVQFFYMNRLSIFDRQAMKLTGNEDIFVEDIFMDAERNRMVRFQSPGNRSKTAEVPEDKQYVPLGVHRKDAHRYTPDAEGMFQCLTSEEEIHHSFVNDDFCDCLDGSDEPGTSACPDYRFFCRYQLSAAKAQVIPSGRVNDGICDCCDGSDEWQGNVVPASIRIGDKQEKLKRPVIHAPCENLCERIEKVLEGDKRIRAEGRKLKRMYLVAAKNVPDKEKYGPHGVFYKLSQNCFEHKTGEYYYKVCPFVSVTQEKFPDAPIKLGQGGRWEWLVGAVSVLTMAKGDGRLCPGPFARTTKISFFCGLEDVVLQVAEEEKCLYRVRFSTPAAC